MTTRISPADAYAKTSAEGYTYVDVRTEAEFEAGHPEGAYNVPFLVDGPTGLVPNPDFAATMDAAFPRDAPLVVGCKAGGRSRRAAQELADRGYTRVFDQRAGWDGARGSFGEITEAGWSRVGLPREEGHPRGRSYADLRAKVR